MKIEISSQRKLKIVYRSYKDAYGLDCNEKFRIIADENDSAIKSVVIHKEDGDNDFEVTGKIIDKGRMTYKDAIRFIEDRIY